MSSKVRLGNFETVYKFCPSHNSDFVDFWFKLRNQALDLLCFSSAQFSLFLSASRDLNGLKHFQYTS
jgi:hypothetical protein